MDKETIIIHDTPTTKEMLVAYGLATAFTLVVIGAMAVTPIIYDKWVDRKDAKILAKANAAQ